MKTALVTGACGLLGQHLVTQLKKYYMVVAVDISDSVFDNSGDTTFFKSDLTDQHNLENIIGEYNPDLVYNCASYTNVDGCEKNREDAFKLNVGVVEGLLAAKVKRLIHFSTDYVFNGNNGPYTEDDITDPIGYYGETKLISENIIWDSTGNHLVVRTNVLFGKGINIRPNFISWLIGNLKNNKPVKIVTDQFNNPTLADNLAEASIGAGCKDISGIINLAGGSYLSRHEMAIKTASHFGLDDSLITPVLTSELRQIAQRPLRGGLIIDKATSLLDCRLMEFNEALNYL